MQPGGEAWWSSRDKKTRNETERGEFWARKITPETGRISFPRASLLAKNGGQGFGWPVITTERICVHARRGLPFSCHRVFMRAPRALKLELKISPLVVVSNVVADSFSSSSFSASSYGFAFNRPCCACWNFKRFVDPIFG